MGIFSIELEVLLLRREQDYLRKYLHVINSSFEEDEKYLAAQVAKYQDGNAGGRDRDLDDYLGDLGFGIEEQQQLMIRSFVVGVMMSIEQFLEYLCQNEKKRKQQIFSHKDLAGPRGINQMLKYLDKIHTKEDPRPFNEAVLQDLKIAIIVRNAIVHSDAVIKSEDPNIKKVSDFSAKHPSLMKVTPGGKIKLESAYMYHLLKLHNGIIMNISLFYKNLGVDRL